MKQIQVIEGKVNYLSNPNYVGDSFVNALNEIGEDIIQAMIEDLKKAQKFIFLEYFIVSDGRVWKEILEILTQKVQEGVEVKLLFDDFGTLIINNHAFRKDLESRGIELRIFNPIHKNVQDCLLIIVTIRRLQ